MPAPTRPRKIRYTSSPPLPVNPTPSKSVGLPVVRPMTPEIQIKIRQPRVPPPIERATTKWSTKTCASVPTVLHRFATSCLSTIGQMPCLFADRNQFANQLGKIVSRRLDASVSDDPALTARLIAMACHRMPEWDRNDSFSMALRISMPASKAIASRRKNSVNVLVLGRGANRSANDIKKKSGVNTQHAAIFKPGMVSRLPA